MALQQVMSPETAFERITRLTGPEDYEMWKFQVRIVLKTHNAYEVACGETVKPERIENETDAAYGIRLSNWTRIDLLAQKVISTSVCGGPLTFIMNCESSSDMWHRLGQAYERKTELNVHLLLQEFYVTKKQNNEDIATFMARIENMSYKLKVLESPVTESMIITKILMSLTDEMKHFQCAWESTPTEDKTLVNLRTRLIAEETRLKRDVKPVALAAIKANDKANDKGMLCFVCKKPGHIKKNCWFNKNKDKKSEKKPFEKKPSPKSGNSSVAMTCYDSLSQCDDESWFLDSGASDHLSRNLKWFVNYKQFDVPLNVKIGNGSIIEALGSGRINLVSIVDGETINCHFENVLYVPDVAMNLVSVGCVMDKGFKLKTDMQKCVLMKDGKTIVTGNRHRKLYKLSIKVIVDEVCTNFALCNSFELWHAGLGHPNKIYTENILKRHNINIPIPKDFFCKYCKFGKQSRLPFKSGKSKTTKIGQLIHTDVCGPMEVNSIGGSRYYVIFKDDFSGFCYLSTIAFKSQVFSKFKIFCGYLENITGEKVRKLRSDNGSEYMSAEFGLFLTNNNIEHEKTVVYTPEQNGCSERENRTIVEMARTMIHSRNLDVKYWAEAVNTAVFILNRTLPHNDNKLTPYELWFGKPYNIDFCRVFGTKAFCHVPKEKRLKWDKKSREGVFVGYGDLTKGYRIYFPTLDTVEILRDVDFENELTISENKFEDSTEQIIYLSKNTTEENENLNEIFEEENGNADEIENENLEINSSMDDSMCTCNDDEFSPSSDCLTPELKSHYNLRNRMCNIMMVDVYEPSNFKQALDSENSDEWKKAMNDEMDSLIKNETWDLVDKPVHVRILSNRWVFKIKRNADFSIDRFKARLVIRGCSQHAGIDYEETYSPVVRYETIRLLLSIAVCKRMTLTQFDIKTAFLYGEVDNEVFMSQPEGFGNGSNQVCRLKKSLYGLKQASRCWNQRFTIFMQRLDFKISDYDPGLYMFHKEHIMILVALYVDDGLVLSNDSNELSRILQCLQSEFDVRIGSLSHFLNMNIKVHEDKIFINQSIYISQLLYQFKMAECRSVKTPIDNIKDLFTDEIETNYNPGFDYRKAVGSLMYLSLISRPDLTFAVNLASRFLEKPKPVHYNLVKRIFRFLRGTTDYELVYGRGDLDVVAFSDSDFGNDLESRKSVTGVVLKVGDNPIIWISRKQGVVSMSTTEAEYIAASEATKELIGVKNILEEILNVSVHAELLIDNQSAIKLVRNPQFHKRSKHIEIKYHFIRENFQKGIFEIKYVKSEDQLGDIFTKPLGTVKFQKAQGELNLRGNIDKNNIY